MTIKEKSKYSQIASAKTEGSPILQGRDLIKTEDIIRRYPDGVTLTSFDILNGQKGPYPVFTIAEDATCFFCGGAVLMDIVNAWIADNNGDVDFTIKDYTESGGVKVKLSRAKNKLGNTYTAVEVVG